MKRKRRIEVRLSRASDFSAWRSGYLGRLPKRNRFDVGPILRSQLGKLSKKTFLEKLKKWRCQPPFVADQVLVYQIFDRTSGEHLGCIDFCILSWRDLRWVNLGYQVHNQYWGEGIATEAVRQAIQIGFKKLGFYRLEAAIQPRNSASVRVAEKSGMKFEGLRKNFIPASHGRGSRSRRDCVIYALDRWGWVKRQGLKTSS